ncbi:MULTISPECIES: hypothetical protein [Nitrosomonas]|uniref:Uncharacterized protein n=1 Tax=Nitrosomonas communis TaxID=44574 RepID=A0A5D3YEN5_9PROT|nr:MULTISPECIES: hypothetical protein [Nitrosomonas]TYP91590.1 hypothetical protein BCL69_100818 [Nitrosomonas communis]UVS59867.1 hypothetical protein NX761_09915 [Nitrosomonas sp. PLL12]
MLRFLSSLFTGTSEQQKGLPEDLIEQAIDRAVAGTDQRIRAIGQYRKRLRQPVEFAVAHVIALVDALPASIEISPRAFGVDPLLRTFFVSTDHLREVLGSFKTLRNYLTDLTDPLPEQIFGLLSMDMEERKGFGMELVGDSLRRDVLQVTVNFSHHRYLGPTSDEMDTRRELKKRAFDFLIEKALERIARERSKRRELDHQWHLLQQKLNTMKAGNWGLDLMLTDHEQQHSDIATLEAEIEAIERELGQFHTDHLGLEESLASVVDTLSHPAAWLASREIRLHLDPMGIKIQDLSTASCKGIVLTEIFSGTGERRIVLLGHIARTDIPEPANIWQEAKRYL